MENVEIKNIVIYSPVGENKYDSFQLLSAFYNFSIARLVYFSL